MVSADKPFLLLAEGEKVVKDPGKLPELESSSSCCCVTSGKFLNLSRLWFLWIITIPVFGGCWEEQTRECMQSLKNGAWHTAKAQAAPAVCVRAAGTRRVSLKPNRAAYQESNLFVPQFPHPHGGGQRRLLF